jgi:hypothetical protein
MTTNTMMQQQTQADLVLTTLAKSRTEGRGEWGALDDALKGVAVINRTVGGRPPVVTYTLADGSKLWRRAAEPILHAEAGAF